MQSNQLRAGHIIPKVPQGNHQNDELTLQPTHSPKSAQQTRVIAKWEDVSIEAYTQKAAQRRSVPVIAAPRDAETVQRGGARVAPAIVGRETR
jgi:hypothetical protein